MSTFYIECTCCFFYSSCYYSSLVFLTEVSPDILRQSWFLFFLPNKNTVHCIIWCEMKPVSQCIFSVHKLWISQKWSHQSGLLTQLNSYIETVFILFFILIVSGTIKELKAAAVPFVSHLVRHFTIVGVVQQAGPCPIKPQARWLIANSARNFSFSISLWWPNYLKYKTR